MELLLIPEVAVYAGNRRVGYVEEDTARDLIRSPGPGLKGQYTMMPRRNGERRIMLVDPSPQNVAKARALCNTSSRAALSATQQEEIYCGLRYPGRGQTPSDGPVTVPKLTVVRKYRKGEGLVDWGEKDRFARRRFNPDKLPPSVYKSEAHYRAVHA